jgi:glycosyltransferase involved in cell wall biosynthesis
MDAASLAISQSIDDLLRRNPELAAECKFLGEVADPQPLYRSSDALVLPSLYEGLPNVVCEAMLAGCPVIASNVCDHPRLLGDGERGVLCDPHSPESIAEAIERFRTMSPAERAEMATRARQFAETHLGMDAMVERYEQLLNGTSSNAADTSGAQVAMRMRGDPT